MGRTALTSRHSGTVFLTGSSGLVGSSLQRRVDADGLHLVPLARGDAIPPRDSSHPAILLHSAWPGNDAVSWGPFRDWSLRLREDVAERDAWFVGLGSGIETHAAHPGLKEPYKSYVMRKLELQEELAALHRERFAWIRLHFMFGPGERPSRVVPAAIRAGFAGEPFVCGSLERRRRWLHVDDQAEYLAAFLKAPAAGTWDIAGRHDVSFRDLLALIERAIGSDLRVAESDDPVPDSRISAISPEKMASVVPNDAGDPSTLLSRLRDYAGQLASQSTGL